MPFDVYWQLTPEDDDNFSYGGKNRKLAILPGDGTGGPRVATSIVEHVLSDYFDSERKWDQWFGLTCSSGTVRCRIYAPEAVAGDYLVDIERVIIARARKAAQ